MSIRKTLAIITVAAAIHASPGPAQDLFPVRFRADCLSFDTNRQQLVRTRISNRSILATALGLSHTNRAAALQGFSLVYNATADTIQVVDTNNAPVADVVHFGGGASTSDARRNERFTFMFLPGQTNEFGLETNAFGSAILTERFVPDRTGTTTNQTITGRLQFFLTGNNALGSTNFTQTVTNELNNGQTNVTTTSGTSATNTGTVFSMTTVSNDPTARICVGSFTAVRPLAETGAGTSGTTNTTTGTTNVITGTTNITIGTTNATTGATSNITIGTTTNSTGVAISILVPTPTVPGTTGVTTTNALGTETSGTLTGGSGTLTGTTGADTTGITGTGVTTVTNPALDTTTDFGTSTGTTTGP